MRAPISLMLAGSLVGVCFPCEADTQVTASTNAPPQIAGTDAPEHPSVPLIHNGSRMKMTQSNDGKIEIRYETPRAGLRSVSKGTVLFRGATDGDQYAGIAYTFKAGCPPAGYAVQGRMIAGTIELVGPAPQRDPHSCAVIGESAKSAHSRLTFDATEWYGE
jgi:hypothetical protein